MTSALPLAHRLGALSLALAALLAPAAAAQSVRPGQVGVTITPPAPVPTEVTVRDVEATVAPFLPVDPGRGTLPLWVRLANRGTRRADVALVATSGWGASMVEVRRAARLEPGEERWVEVLVPRMWNVHDQVAVLVRVGGQRRSLPNAGPARQPSEVLWNVGWLGDERPRGSVLEAWGEALSPELRGRFVDAGHALPGSLRTAQRGAVALRSPTRVEAVAAEPARAAVHGLSGPLPSRHEGWTPLDAVVVESAFLESERARLESLLAWARLGGVLAVTGPDAEAVVRRTPGLAEWDEERFAVAESDGVRTVRIALGRLLVSERGLDTHELREALAQALVEEPGWVPGSQGSRGTRAAPDLAVPELPLRTLTLVLLFFALVLGPLNFWLVRRAGRPVLLLVTVPALALVFSGGLLAFGLVYQGLDTRQAARSLAVLDQRARRVDVVQARQLFAGLPARAGLAPDAGTALHAVHNAAYPMASTSGGHLVTEDGGERRYAGEYLPARSTVEQVLATERAARLRLELSAAGGVLAAHNALEVPLAQLLVRDPDGDLWRAEGLAAGARAELTPAADAVPFADAHESLAGYALPSGCWLARLDGPSPFADDGGVEVRELEGEHWVLGVLDPAEVWR